MRTRGAVPQIDLAQRVLENLAVVTDQRCRRFVPKDGPMLETVEAIQANVLKIGAAQLENFPQRKKTPDELGLARA